MRCDCRNRVLVALLLALIAGLAAHAKQDGGDLGVAFRQAKELLAHGSPYPAASNEVLYPLPAVLLALPLTYFSAATAGGIFFAVSVGLLAFAVTRDGWWRLWIFSAFPFLSAVVAVQWSPLLMASVFFPAIGSLAFKPQIAIPCAVRSRSWISIFSATLIVLFSLMIEPEWPIAWIHHTKGYIHYSPIFWGAGFAMLVGVLWIREADWQFLLTMAVVPQRFFYDAFPLWLIPANGKEMAFLSASSWIGFAYFSQFLPNETFQQVWNWCVFFSYLPAFLILIRRKFKTRTLGSKPQNSASPTELSSIEQAR